MAPRHPVLFVSWRSPQTRSILPVGRLVYRDELGLYEFVYIRKAREAAELGFLPFFEFPEFGRVYRGAALFPLFANRVLPTNRPEFGDYLHALGLSTDLSDPMNILARSGGRRVTDRIEMFPLPLPDPQSGAYVVHCLLRGIQYMRPEVESRIAQLEPGENLFMVLDVQNEVDRDAIAVRTNDFAFLGFLPAYLTRDLRRLFDGVVDCRVSVERVNPASAGVHHRLLCRIEGAWPDGFVPFTTDEYQPIPSEATDLAAWIQPRVASALDKPFVMDTAQVATTSAR